MGLSDTFAGTTDPKGRSDPATDFNRRPQFVSSVWAAAIAAKQEFNGRSQSANCGHWLLSLRLET